MGQVKFEVAFSGGAGDLVIQFPLTGILIHFTNVSSAPIVITMPYGVQPGTIHGDAPNGPGGNIKLKITGDIPHEADFVYNAGLIPPHPLSLYVTK